MCLDEAGDDGTATGVDDADRAPVTAELRFRDLPDGFDASAVDEQVAVDDRARRVASHELPTGNEHSHGAGTLNDPARIVPLHVCRSEQGSTSYVVSMARRGLPL